MNEKRDIDRLRDSGGKAEIGTPEDGAIIEMKSIAGRLLVIKERAIYETVFADTIDPDRTNIDLPQMIQKLIINQGTESELVARIFLTAKNLFRKEYISQTVNCDEVLSLSIDLLSEMSILEKEIKLYLEDEKKAINEYEQRKVRKASFELPTVISLESRCKTIFQKADQIEQILMDIITHFYPNSGLTKQSHFPKFHEILKLKYGASADFVEFINKTLTFMKIVRETRNGLDHRLESTKIKNFDLQTDGSILTPTIELNYKDVNLERVSLHEFLEVLVPNFMDVIETTIAFLAGYNLRNTGIAFQVRQIPEEKRLHKLVKYGIWIPFGEDGFYNQ